MKPTLLTLAQAAGLSPGQRASKPHFPPLAGSKIYLRNGRLAQVVDQREDVIEPYVVAVFADHNQTDIAEYINLTYSGRCFYSGSILADPQYECIALIKD